MAKRRPTLTVFLDSSVLFSAVNSPTGGSARIFTEKDLNLIVSTLVLTEVERNIRDKLADYHLTRFFLLADRLIILNRIPNQKQIESAKQVIAGKDAAILVSAKLAKTQILLTLDQRHFLISTVKRFIIATQKTPRLRRGDECCDYSLPRKARWNTEKGFSAALVNLNHRKPRTFSPRKFIKPTKILTPKMFFTGKSRI